MGSGALKLTLSDFGDVSARLKGRSHGFTALGGFGLKSLSGCKLFRVLGMFGVIRLDSGLITWTPSVCRIIAFCWCWAIFA